jgi:uncharacterized protein involved in type VI secretion and phage assembly
MALLDLLTETCVQASQTDRIYGVVTGIVQDIQDPKKMGRVKVDFPWLAEDADRVITAEGREEKKAHSYWARIAMLMAGSGRGTWFIPQVGDEVLVAFEHGELDRPFVIGTLWNKEDPPPEEMDGQGKNDLRVIHSRSGHRIVINDSEDKPSILIVDQTGDNSVLIDSAENSIQIVAAEDISIEAGGNISIKAEGEIDVQAGKDLTAEAGTNLKITAGAKADLESTGQMSLKSSAKLAMEGSGGADLKGAMVTVNGSGMTEIKGGLVKIN